MHIPYKHIIYVLECFRIVAFPDSGVDGRGRFIEILEKTSYLPKGAKMEKNN
jgi:hypothetical protein